MKKLFSAAIVLGAIGVLAPAFLHGKTRNWLALARSNPTTASRENPYDRDSEAVRAGQKLYDRYCAGCHGAGAEGGRGPSLHSATVKDASPGELAWLLRNGSLWRGMPSWSNLPPEQRWQLVVWLKSLD